jgi:hypothetical protein
VYFSPETPLRDSLDSSRAKVQITSRHNFSDEHEDSNSPTSRDLFFDGQPIEYKMYHGKEILV